MLKSAYKPHVLGKQAEDAALHYLKRQGLKLVARNFHCRSGEVDLIMRDGKMLVFVEVRLRNSTICGTGLESVTRAKQRKIMRSAEFYLLKKGLTYKISYRFDIISVRQKEDKFDIYWAKNAFEYS
jgi:putative endonuclease